MEILGYRTVKVKAVPKMCFTLKDIFYRRKNVSDRVSE